MLDKTLGAVTCGHCRGPGADQPCKTCGAAVCPACAAADNCPEPRPRELRLGTGRGSASGC